MAVYVVSLATNQATKDTGPLVVLDDVGDTLAVQRIQAFDSTGLTVRTSDEATAVFVRTDGNVGVNTTSPDRKLEVEDGSDLAQLRVTHTDATHFTDLFTTNNGTFRLTPTARTVQVDTGDANGGNLQFTKSGGIISGGVSWDTGDQDVTIYSEADLMLGAGGSSAKVFINNDGNVGVNTTSPDRKLDVEDDSDLPQLRLTYDASNSSDLTTTSNGTLRLSPSSRTVQVDTGDANGGNLQFSKSGGIVSGGVSWDTGDQDVTIYSEADLYLGAGGSSQKMVVDNGGNVGVGCTTPDRKFDVEDGSDVAQLRVTHTDATHFTDLFTTNNGTFRLTPTARTVQVDTGDANGGNLQFTKSGGVVSGGVSWDTGDQDVTIYSEADLMLGAGGSSAKVFIDNGGNVGIGTETPNCMLHVAGAAAFSGPSETFVTFGSSDTTPSVATGNLFKTHASGQTLTTFDDGVAGQTITVISTAAVVFDISATLKGGSTNITTAAGDVTTWTYDGLNWYLVQFMDVDADHSSIGGGGGGGGTWKVEADGSSSVGSPVTPAADTVVMACATSAARYVQLPAVSGLTDRVIAIKDSGGGGASTNNITIKTNASETIDGSASDIVISTDYASITLVCTGSSWMIV